ncbi:MAG: ABC transporter permease [Oligoflexia bacterium]|nr:ABC transporter permease [Oligoflexia bacterium]
MIALAFFISIIRMATPLVFASLGGMFSERSGVINIALEGIMLFGAFTAAFVSLSMGKELGFVAGGLGGMSLALIYGLIVIHGRANQIVAGTAINLLAMGLIPLFLKSLYDSTGGTPSLSMDQRFSNLPILFMIIALAGAWFVMKKTSFGLNVSVAGENPEALDAAGISVILVRYQSLAVCGLLAGFGGASLSLFLASGYTRNMVAGRGFMALAALIFGKWKPVPTFLACILFGAFEAVQIRLQGAEGIPPEFLQILPYLATVLVLAGFVGKAVAPKVIGIPWKR